MARLRQDYGAASAIDKAVRAQGGGVVGPNQVKAMILAARRAFKVQSELGLVDDGVGFDAWRRATLHDVTGGDAPESFRTVTQRDYAAVMEYFARLAGGSVEKLNVEKFKSSKTFQPFNSSTFQLRETDAQRRALWALNLEEGEAADAFGGRGEARKYADALFWKIHKTERSLATPRQIWAAIFTLRNRARSKLKGSEVEKLKSSKTFQPFNPSTLNPQTRARKGLGARGAAGVPLSPPDGSERFPVFSRGL